jgi:predicted RNA-binding protein
LDKAKASDLKRIYDIDDWIDDHDFLKKVAVKKGKLARVLYNHNIIFREEKLIQKQQPN